MMIHPAHKRPVGAEDALNFRRPAKLPRAVKVSLVSDRPPLPHASVDPRAIRPEPRPRLHVLEEEVEGVAPLRCGTRKNVEGELPRPCLLPHEESPAREEGLIELHDALPYMGF